jgi:hypothetical protein
MLHTSISACGKLFSLNFSIADITITITWLLSVLYFRYHFVPRHFATSPTGITSGTGTAYHSEAHEFTPGF